MMDVWHAVENENYQGIFLCVDLLPWVPTLILIIRRLDRCRKKGLLASISLSLEVSR